MRPPLDGGRQSAKVTVNQNTAAIVPSISPEASERHQLIEAVRNHLGLSTKDAIARLDGFSMPRVERERQLAERARRAEAQRHYAGQILAAMCSETDRAVRLSDEAVKKVCTEAHRIAQCMVGLEAEFIDNDAA
jgi:hypothetical protein